MSLAVVTELDDRWVVNTRPSLVSDLAASPHVLRTELDSGLWIEVAGRWRATVGSPITGEELSVDDLGGQVGSEILSLVLFATGSIRIVLSTGVTVVVDADDAARVSATLPGEFTWEAHGHSMTRFLADPGDDD